MDETDFNVVYFFKYFVDLQGNYICIIKISFFWFEICFKHYCTKYFIFHILYVAHMYHINDIVFKLLFKKTRQLL